MSLIISEVSILLCIILYFPRDCISCINVTLTINSGQHVSKVNWQLTKIDNNALILSDSIYNVTNQTTIQTSGCVDSSTCYNAIVSTSDLDIDSDDGWFMIHLDDKIITLGKQSLRCSDDDDDALESTCMVKFCTDFFSNSDKTLTVISYQYSFDLSIIFVDNNVDEQEQYYFNSYQFMSDLYGNTSMKNTFSIADGCYIISINNTEYSSQDGYYSVSIGNYSVSSDDTINIIDTCAFESTSQPTQMTGLTSYVNRQVSIFESKKTL